MSLQDGMAAINLEMPPRVPRTEYSADHHWELVKQVTGFDVAYSDDPEVKANASQAFIRAWNYDFMWNILINAPEFGEVHTDMGHAVYDADGSDFREIGQALFTDPQQVLDFDPWESLGAKDHETLIRRFEEHYQKAVRENPDAVNMTGIYITLVSGLITCRWVG